VGILEDLREISYIEKRGEVEIKQKAIEITKGDREMRYREDKVN